MNKICCNCGSREIRQGSLDSQVDLKTETACLLIYILFID